MDIKKEISEGKGYAVVEIENMDLLSQLQKSFIKKIGISNNTNNDINFVRQKVAKMSKAEVNKCMIDLLKLNNLSEMIINSCPKLVESLCGKELFIQRRATFVMNVPGEGQAKQWPHYELMSGISPYSYIIWAPLHDLEENSGVYYFDQSRSLEMMKKEQEKGIVNGPMILNMMSNQKPEKLNFGQAVIFNPFLLHGNTVFDSELARVACTTRFQSSNKPLLQKNSDYLKFYSLN
jgi:sporadic carbohydrate cluster 2OG-Fe(II) oxygenase|tara:strand:+ start:185 stop:889 length:705 start_codon:yes stop_codon:yes gene_type:complete